MTVTKTTRECYEVRPATAPGEWANITLQCWQAALHKGVEYSAGGEIVINSSFGTWSNTWNACGVPFKKFLIDCDFDYIFTKFMGHNLRRFDAEASWQAVQKRILQQRREGHIDKAEAREAWDTVEEHVDAAHNERDFGYGMMDIADELSNLHPMREDFSDPMGWPSETRYDHQAVGFWRQIWPEFAAALRVEIDHPTAELIELHMNA